MLKNALRIANSQQHSDFKKRKFMFNLYRSEWGPFIWSDMSVHIMHNAILAAKKKGHR